MKVQLVILKTIKSGIMLIRKETYREKLTGDAKLILDILTPVWKSIKYWWSPRSFIHSWFSLETILVEKFEISESETPTPKCSAPEICLAWKVAPFYGEI